MIQYVPAKLKTMIEKTYELLEPGGNNVAMNPVQTEDRNWYRQIRK